LIKDVITAKKRKILLPFSLLLLAAILLHSKYALTVTHYTVSADNLPAQFDSFRIVQLSDLHGSEFGSDNGRLVKAAARLSPDIIALTGDFIESEADIATTQTLVRQLSTIAPVYFTSGNHDWASGAISQLRSAVNDNGGKYLSNEALVLQKDNASIVLAGVEDPNSRADLPTPDVFLQTVQKRYPNQFTILLAHRNDFIEKYPDLPCDLIFTGHGHGGVVRLPFAGGVFGTDLTWFPDYDAGIFQSKRYQMVVSRGLGSSPPLPRFLNPPEIVCVTLHQK